MNTTDRKNFIYWIPSLMIMVVIFLASNDPSSGEKTDFITKFIFNLIYKLSGYQATLVDESSLTFIIRKFAHMTEYLILTLSYFFSLKKTFLKKSYFYNIYFCSLIFGVIYASTDEFHQTFIPGRVGTYEDVLIDSSGMLISIFIASFLYRKKIF